MSASACPCGCGLLVPIVASNIYRERLPYWEWVCLNPACVVYARRWKNQSGDAACSWCGEERELVGHFRSGTANGYTRTTVLGKKVVTRSVAW